jgi:hypothetical protein
MAVMKIPMAGAHNIYTDPWSVRGGIEKRTEYSNQKDAFTFIIKRRGRPPCP